MGLESATHISQLVSANPVGGDSEGQGDDHLRMIKTALQTDFPNASRPYYFPRMLAKVADFAITAVQQNMTFVVDTSGGVVTATLPTLGASDDGWECFFIKINAGVNPLFIQPPSGTIVSGEVLSLTKTRRCIPGRKTRVGWSGTGFIAERVETDPIGTVKANFLSTTPIGYEPANGTALSSAANYPDYNSVKGSLLIPDCRGRVIAGRESVGTRLTAAGSGVDGGVLGNVGGAETIVLTQANLPAANLSSSGLTGNLVDTSINNGTNVARNPSTNNNSQAGGGSNIVNSVATATLSVNDGFVDINGTVPLGGSSTPVNDVQPTIVLSYIIVVE